MFQLSEQPANIKFTPRVEKHGPDKVPACTLNMSLKGPNTLLDFFDTDLRAFLFMPPPEGEKDLADQGDEDGGYLSKIRFPELGKKQDWSYEGGGYRAVIGGGLNTDNDLIFVECKLDKFSFTFEQGGTVCITFNITCDPNEKEAGRLYKLNGSEVDLTLEPPSAEDQAQMDLDNAA